MEKPLLAKHFVASGFTTGFGAMDSLRLSDFETWYLRHAVKPNHDGEVRNAAGSA
jgi:hypothetical protein